MKFQTKFLSVLLTLSLAAVPALKAQSADENKQPARERGQGGPGGGRGGPNIEMLEKELGLSADQKAKLEPILKAQGQKMQELRDLPQDQRREKGRALREATQKEIEAVLTPDQIKKFGELRQRGGQGQRGGGGGERPAPQGEKKADK